MVPGPELAVDVDVLVHQALLGDEQVPRQFQLFGSDGRNLELDESIARDAVPTFDGATLNLPISS